MESTYFTSISSLRGTILGKQIESQRLDFHGEVEVCPPGNQVLETRFIYRPSKPRFQTEKMKFSQVLEYKTQTQHKSNQIHPQQSPKIQIKKIKTPKPIRSERERI